MAVRFCTAESLPVTVIVTVAPTGAVLVVPVIDGVASLLLSGASTEILGATVSTLPVSLSVVLLPDASVIVALTV